MKEQQSDFDIFASNLVQARFEAIFEDKGDLDQFYNFLRTSAVLAGGFVMSYPVTEGGLHWVLYRIKEVKDKGSKLDLVLDSAELLYSDDPTDRSKPDECMGYPVWWLEEQFKKKNA